MSDPLIPDPTPGSPGRSVILVGVQRQLPDTVLITAAHLAHDLRADLVCAHVDMARYTVGERLDGSVLSRSIDPDLPDDEEGEFDAALAAHIDDVLAATGTGIEWTGRERAGDPAHALARLADAVGARMIVVGTRDATVAGTLREFFQGSVATHLAHRQHRPVVVVPLSPVSEETTLPWE